MTPHPSRLHAILADLLPATAMRWVDEARAAVAADPSAVFSRLAAAGVRCGRGPLGPGGGDWTVDEAVRALLLCALPLKQPKLGETVETAYREGDARERRAILRALGFVIADDRAVPLLRDALRSNDPGLVAAALGPYAAEHLDQPSWRDGVLKCVFMGIPLAAVAGLQRRMDPELLRMFRDYATERLAAGRPVPDDLRAVLDTREA